MVIKSPGAEPAMSRWVKVEGKELKLTPLVRKPLRKRRGTRRGPAGKAGRRRPGLSVWRWSRTHVHDD